MSAIVVFERDRFDFERRWVDDENDPTLFPDGVNGSIAPTDATDECNPSRC